MDLKTRKRLSILILVIGLPAYLIAAWWLLNWIDDRFGRMPLWLELPVYIVLAVAWVIPFKRVFSGVGQGE